MMDRIGRIWRILKKNERRRLALLLTADLLLSVLDIAFLAALVVLISAYSGGVRIGDAGGWLTGVWSGSVRGTGFFVPMLAFFFLFAIKNLAAYILLKARFHFVYRVAARLGGSGLAQYLESDYTAYVEVDSSVHTRRISQQPIEFCQYILAGGMQAVTESALVLLAVGAICWYDARLFGLLLALLLPAIGLLGWMTRRRLRVVRAQVRSASEHSLQYLREALGGYAESNIYGRNAYFTERYRDQQGRLNHYLAELQITQGMPSRVIEVFAMLGLLLLVGLHATAFVTLGAFLAAAYKIIPGIVRLSNLGAQFRTFSYTIDDIYAAGREATALREGAALEEGTALGDGAALDEETALGEVTALEEETALGEVPVSREETEADDSARVEGVVAANGDEAKGDALLYSVSFAEVGFGHGQKHVLEGLSFGIGRGELVGISGVSGRGKTTILHLLLGFYSQQAGKICFNGRVVDERARRKWWGRIAYVRQHAFVLNDTVLRNITLGDDRYNEERMRLAVAASGWPGSYPDCLQRSLSEQGKNISGGQRQRIAIARALYKDADLIVLDEPFNELDREASRVLLKGLRELCGGGRMVILITHDQESFDWCDRVVCLNELTERSSL